MHPITTVLPSTNLHREIASKRPILDGQGCYPYHNHALYPSSNRSFGSYERNSPSGEHVDHFNRNATFQHGTERSLETLGTSTRTIAHPTDHRNDHKILSTLDRDRSSVHPHFPFAPPPYVRLIVLERMYLRAQPEHTASTNSESLSLTQPNKHR